MPTCVERVWPALLLSITTTLWAGAITATPYGEVSLPMQLQKVPDTPVYYLVGLSGVPDAENEGHTSNAGFVVTDNGVVVFDALGTPALGYRMLQRIREVTDRPIERIIISHYHADPIYGLQAFKEHAGNPPVYAQRREALFPWVDENTWIVPPDQTFSQELHIKVGGVKFLVRHLGQAHATGDAVMLIQDHSVLFSGDVIYRGRAPFLDSPETDTGHWLEGLDYLTGLEPSPRFIIPGHGDASDDPGTAVAATREYIQFVRDAMRRAVEDFLSFDEAYGRTDWSRYEDLPAFDASNRGNAFHIFLEMEAASF